MPSQGNSPAFGVEREGKLISPRPPAQPPAAPAKSDYAPLAILALAVVGVLGVLPSLATPDLNWCYPYMGPDSWDWLANGIFWSGAPIAASFRPPGLPLVMALLHRCSALPLLPYLNFAMLGLAAFLLHRLVRLRHSPLVAALAVLLFVSNGSLFGYARYVMGEVWTLPFLVGAAIAFVRAAETPRRYLLCAALLSVSFLFHYAGAVVGAGLGLAALLYRRRDFATRWPWLALAVAAPLPAAWIVVRALHNRASGNVHVVEGLVHPSVDNLWYYAVVATALVGLVAVPVYLAGFIRLLRGDGKRLAPWAQAVLFPLVSLALFFTLAYSWADKRFLYYLLPFAVAGAAEGIALVVTFAHGGRLKATLATLLLAVVLLWNRIPYPATSHTLLALTPRDFWDAAHGLPTAKMQSVSSTWSIGLLATDGFASFRSPQATCTNPREFAATRELRSFVEARLEAGEPIALAGRGGDSTSYWTDTNRITIALERPVEKPATARFILRRVGPPDAFTSSAIATIGPFDVYDVQTLPGTDPAPPRPKHKRKRKAAE
jgi:hypothetical protein